MKVDRFIEHPEGGRFCEVFRSTLRVITDDRRARSALTHIHFSLERGEVSRFHRVASDEVWNLYRGDGVRLHLWDEETHQLSHVELSAATEEYCHVVPAGVWQAAEPIGESVLVGCSVGPGFEFQDFELIDPGSRIAERILDADGRLARFTEKQAAI